MKDYQLLNYYYSLDIDIVNLQHYGLVKNTMIERGLLNGSLTNLNDYIDLDSFEIKIEEIFVIEDYKCLSKFN